MNGLKNLGMKTDFLVHKILVLNDRFSSGKLKFLKDDQVKILILAIGS